jgi:hypothetical protein|tara:strand:- start:12017 stop:12418 length:402 start_codon:yes stop_codon:yes gene_type:complete
MGRGVREHWLWNVNDWPQLFISIQIIVWRLAGGMVTIGLFVAALRIFGNGISYNWISRKSVLVCGIAQLFRFKPSQHSSDRYIRLFDGIHEGLSLGTIRDAYDGVRICSETLQSTSYIRLGKIGWLWTYGPGN